MAKLRVGVIIGRFQVPELHAGHYRLFEFVRERCDQIVVMLGISPVDGYSAENPLTFNQRQAVVQAGITHGWPSAPVVLPLLDMRTNEAWSAQIDGLLRGAYPLDDITLYGGRDSFVESYRGKIPVERFVASPALPDAGTFNRASIKEAKSPEFFRGQIFALQRQFPHAFPTVDIAYMKDGLVLVIQRADSGEWCFPGGFVDPTDESLESAAKRELMEEVGLTTEHALIHLGSVRINDFRYRGVRDKIITTFFLARHTWGTVMPNYAEVQDYKWVAPVDSNVSNAHWPLILMLRKYLGQEAEDLRHV